MLCTGEKGIGTNGKPLHYRGSKFHKGVCELLNTVEQLFTYKKCFVTF